MANPREMNLRRYFRNLLRKHRVWTASVEHRSGGSTGMPDVLVQLGEGLVPVELKVGRWRGEDEDDNGILRCSQIRPAQIGFLNAAAEAGIMARLMIGVPVEKQWSIWMLRNVRRENLMRWREGFNETELELVVSANEGDLVLPVTQW